jgi:3-oxoacyl-[acyl-carrier protein] reductase
MDFENRIALVTGGSRGIGRAAALRLAREGADVAISYASRLEAAKQVVEEIKDLGQRGLCVKCDVSKPGDVEQLMKDVHENLGRIDLLVHCGAITKVCDHSQLTYEAWRETIDIDLNGTYLVVFAVKNEMIERRYGRIVTTASVAALRPRKMLIHYSTAKAGVIAFTRSCAEAWAPYNVRINCVAPGLIDTEMAREISDEARDALIKSTPMARIGQPEEIAAIIRFLLSDESSFMTGQTVGASGGRITLP